jgi:hypothetical protein
MNKRILTFAAVLAATLIAGVFATTPMAAYAGGDDGDSSETKTKQEIKQSNRGSGSSTNINCGDNDINSESLLEAQVCGTLDIGEDDPPVRGPPV